MSLMNFADFPHKSILSGKEISSFGSTFSREYLYGRQKLPDLWSPTVDQVNSDIESLSCCLEDGSWRQLCVADKRSIIEKAITYLEESVQEVSTYDCLETGRSLYSLQNHSLPKAVQTMRWFCSAIEHDHLAAFADNTSCDYALSFRHPYGICLCILPWNDPLVLFSWKVIPALLLGNSVIVKPSEYSSASALFFSKLLIKSGLPPSALSVIVGRDLNVLNHLVSHKHVKSISMTGSTKTALAIQNTASGSGYLKKLSFECGGKSPFVVTSSNSKTSLRKACSVIAENIFFNQGQICSASSLLVLPKEFVVFFRETLTHLMQQYLPQNPLSGLVNSVGTMCIRESIPRIEEFLSRARSVGCEIIQSELNDDKLYGCSMPPTLLLVDSYTYLSHPFLSQELFGPVLTIVHVDDDLDAIKIANSSDYGLAAAVWSESYAEVNYFTHHIEAGIVHINSYGMDGIGIPFGGIKNSGEAKEKCLEAFDQFSYKKIVYHAGSIL